MKISSSTNMNGKKNTSQSFKGIPVKPIFIPELLGDIGRNVGANIGGAEQKLILASTAVFLRPLIDLKFAEEDKKVDSAIQSTSKAIAGGITGVTIRAFFIKLADKLIKLRGEVFEDKLKEKIYTSGEINELKEKFGEYISKISLLLLPKKVDQTDITQNIKAVHQKSQYTKSIGGLIAVLVMAFYTNSAWDAPLTEDFIKFFNGIIKEKKTPLESLTAVVQDRHEIIKNWFKNKENKAKKQVEKVKNFLKLTKKETE